MIPEKVASEITLCDDAQGERLRKQYIDAFVDTASAWYNEKIAKLQKFSDGLCYVGYLWECLLQKPDVVGLSDVNRRLASKSSVYVFWDIHSKDKIQIPNYWNFPKRAVVAVDGKL